MVIRSVRRLARIGAFAGLTGTMAPAFFLRESFAQTAQRSRIRDRWMRTWCDGMLRAFSVELVVLGDGDHLRSGTRGRLVVSNHRSAIDIVALFRVFGGVMVSRGDVASWPLLGTAASKLGTVFVDRDSKTSGAVAIRAMRDLLRAGSSVTIFPEGTTFSGDEVRPFRPGGFLAAKHLDVDIVPVGIAYPHGSEAAYGDETFTEHLSRLAGAGPSTVVVSAGPSLAVPTSVPVSALSAAAHSAVAREVARARAECNRLTSV